MDEGKGGIWLALICLFIAYLGGWWPFQKDEDTELYKTGYQKGERDGYYEGIDAVCEEVKKISDDFYNKLKSENNC